MRRETYRVLEIVAWPAAAWSALELALRTVSGAHGGTPATLVLGAMAAATIAACRIRTAQLASATVPTQS